MCAGHLDGQLGVDVGAQVTFHVDLGHRLDPKEQGAEDSCTCGSSGWDSKPLFQIALSYHVKFFQVSLVHGVDSEVVSEGRQCISGVI